MKNYKLNFKVLVASILILFYPIKIYALENHFFIVPIAGLNFEQKQPLNYHIGGNAGWSIDWLKKNDSRIGTFIEFAYDFSFGDKNISENQYRSEYISTAYHNYNIAIGLDLKYSFFVFQPKLAYYIDNNSFDIPVFLDFAFELYNNGNIGWTVLGGINVPRILNFDKGGIDVILGIGMLIDPNRNKEISRLQNIQNQDEKIKNEEQARQASAEQQRKEEQQRIATEQIRIRNEQQRLKEEQDKNEADNAYLTALKSAEIELLTKYIQNYKYSAYFQNESFNDLARRLAKNNTIKILTLQSGCSVDISNPYNFDFNAIYFCEGFRVQQWIDTSLLADISNSETSRRDTMIYIQNVYNVKNVSRYVSNAYLKYIGTETYKAVSGAHTVVAKFDLLYSFDVVYTGTGK